MKTLVLGATGSIGTAVTKELIANGHSVIALSRSSESDAKLRQWGARPFRGDLRNPIAWADKVKDCDGIIQVAATFTDDMDAVDHAVLVALEQAVQRSGIRPRLIYTGGCWMYGNTGDLVATEDTPFNPLAEFAWADRTATNLLASRNFSCAIIHPAMVCHEGGGVFARFVQAVQAQNPVEIWGNADTRWPLIHRDDLAIAYRLLLERRDLTGHFNAVAQQSIRVGQIANALSTHFNSPATPIIRDIADVIAEFGGWAAGTVLDQQMSAQKLRDATGWRPKYSDFTDVSSYI